LSSSIRGCRAAAGLLVLLSLAARESVYIRTEY
jgi:hypothetical protein